MAAPAAAVSKLRARRTSKVADKPTHNFMERMPCEILMRILSHLDASALYTISHINKHFHRLASDDSLWKKLCTKQFSKQKLSTLAAELQLQMSSLQLQDPAAGRWRSLYCRAMATGDMQKCRRLVQIVSPHTGFPCQIKRILRSLQVAWELTLTDRSGRETTLDLSWSHFLETSVTLCWRAGGRVPVYPQIATLRLHGVRRIRLNCPGLKPPGCRSLLATVDMQTLSERAQVIGRSKVVELKLLQPGAAVGVWKGEHSVAFIMLTLHFNSLQKSSQGPFACLLAEPTVEPPSHDIDPEYGLHGYHLHVGLHNSACELISGSFPQLFCRRSQISDGLIQLVAISRTNASQHATLSGDVTLQWQTNALRGVIENCCILSLTLLDEFGKPFKCFSSPVCLEPGEAAASFDYDGEHFLIHYQDSDSQVKLNLVRTAKHQQFIVTGLVVYLSVCSVNKHFSCEY